MSKAGRAYVEVWLVLASICARAVGRTFPNTSRHMSRATRYLAARAGLGIQRLRWQVQREERMNELLGPLEDRGWAQKCIGSVASRNASHLVVGSGLLPGAKQSLFPSFIPTCV